jgi:TetR/AcrR family transcriptional regulator, repressor of fatR-cypB operon
MEARFSHEDADAPGKRAILGAALKLFVAKGIDPTSVRDIGTLAGLSNPALFRHFASKEDLALELFGRIFRRFAATLPAADASPFAGQVRRALAAYLDFFDQDLEAALYFQENLRRLWPQLPREQRGASLLTRWREVVDAGVAQGVVSAGDDPRLLVVLVTGTLGQLARQLYFGEIEAPSIGLLDQIHALVLRSLAPPVAREGDAAPHSSKRSS